jgi:hypothetical protein
VRKRARFGTDHGKAENALVVLDDRIWLFPAINNPEPSSSVFSERNCRGRISSQGAP